MNTWSESLLNKTNLNTNFINNIGTKWADKIATTTWKVGGNTSANIMESISSVVYLNEIVKPISTNTTDNKTEYTGKIGLMYISDYGFAASPSTWTTTLYDYKNLSMSAINWMYMGLSECTISRSSEQSNAIIYLYIFGGMSTGNVHFGYAVRPTFSLLSSTIYVSGSGSADDPILIK